MEYSYELSDLAIMDISETIDYITKKLFNLKAATDLLYKIEETIDKICMFPFSYPNCKYYFINIS